MCNFERTKTFKNMLTNYQRFDNIYMSSGDDALQGNTRFPFRTRRLSLLRPMVLHGRLCGRVGGCQVIWIFSSVGQSNRLITGRSGVRVPEGPPFLGVQLSWESTCLARKGSRVRLPLPPPKATNYFVAFFYCVPSVGNNLIMKVIGRYYVGQNR